MNDEVEEFFLINSNGKRFMNRDAGAFN